ncbi:hypothetical protein AB0E08_48830 [Streptomyces sp. NPDC048281]|uniref:hypothetical protein n=1 Tax=Streptomyces sp. NPDC048281 TaxID=3154715 RepID=UPI003414D1F1
MATSVLPHPKPSLNASQAVALILLRDGYTERTIAARTGTEPTALYQLAAQHDITAPHGTVEGHNCHQAAGTEPCDECNLADARNQARTLARHRKSLTSLPRALQRQANLPHGTGRRKAAR